MGSEMRMEIGFWFEEMLRLNWFSVLDETVFQVHLKNRPDGFV